MPFVPGNHLRQGRRSRRVEHHLCSHANLPIPHIGWPLAFLKKCSSPRHSSYCVRGVKSCPDRPTAPLSICTLTMFYSFRIGGDLGAEAGRDRLLLVHREWEGARATGEKNISLRIRSGWNGRVVPKQGGIEKLSNRNSRKRANWTLLISV